MREVPAHLKPIGTLLDEIIDEEVKEVCMYLLAKIAMEDMMMDSMVTKSETTKIDTQVMFAFDRLESGLSKNEFYKAYQPYISMLFSLDRIRTKMFYNMLTASAKNNSEELRKKALITMHSRFDTLVGVAHLWKGMDYAVEFGSKLRTLYNLPNGF
jgi:hypothetical protein